MRFEKIRLVGYAGIYNGMALQEIELDFTKCKSNKIIIRGSNGSGKSTIMSAIHPFPDSNDKFIPGVLAEKDILISADEGVMYLIKYTHSVTRDGQRATAKGYITKITNGETIQLNPEGSISTCRDLIYTEMAIDPGFLALSQLSSENRGIVDKKPAERKKMINAVVSSVETFNGIFKNISKKMSTIKSFIQSISAKIDQIGDESKLIQTLEGVEKKLEEMNGDKEKAIELTATLRLKIDSLRDILEQNHYDDIVVELSQKQAILSKLKKDLEALQAKYQVTDVESLRTILLSLEQDLSQEAAQLAVIRQRIPIIMAEQQADLDKVRDKQAKLQNLQSELNYTDLVKAYEAAKKRASEIEAIFANMRLQNISILTKDEFDIAMKAINNLRQMSEVVLASFPMEYIRADINNRLSVQSFIASYDSLTLQLAEARKRESYLTSQSAIFASKRDLAKILVDRPTECSIDTCPYIAEALNADREYPESEFQVILQELQALGVTIKKLEDDIQRCSIADKVRQQISMIERELHNNIRFINKLPIRADFVETFFDRVLALDPFNDLIELYKYVDCGNMIEEYKVLSESIQTYKAELKIYESKSQLIQNYMNDIAELREKIDKTREIVSELSAKIKTLSDSTTALQTDVQVLREVITLYDKQYVALTARVSELVQLKDNLSASAANLKKYEGQQQQLTEYSSSLSTDIQILTNQQQSLRFSAQKLKEYQADLATYKKLYTQVERIHYYSSPNTGISSVYVSIFMNKILATANDLLSYLFGGEFSIQNFVITPDSFMIPIIGDGLLHDDITSMSSAQKAMISLIVSFAMIQQTSSCYNVVTLDEYDGCMDQFNRGAFVQLLNRLMELIGSEQAFIISHNNELDVSECDIIALKNTSDEFIGGNVIWDYRTAPRPEGK